MATESERAADTTSQSTPEKVAKRSWKTRLRKLAFRSIVAVFFLMVAGFAWDQIATWNFLRNYPPPGEMFEVDGIKLHAVIRGEREAGEPAIVIEPGMDSGTSAWLHIVKELESHAQVFVLDRRGIGYSESRGGNRTPDQNVADLRQVLELSGVAPPYLLVGHSLGGHNIRLFESLYPDEVTGMILVDAVNTDHLPSPGDAPPLFLECVASTGRFGSTRLLALFKPGKSPYPEIDFDRIAGTRSQGTYVRAVLNHWYGAGVDWEERRAMIHKTIDVPVTIIAAKGPPIGGLRWSEGQQRLRDLSPNAKFINNGRHHDLHIRQSELVLNEIKAMLDK